jgi:carbohydrate kinase (thermoresistant glucokinase family)
MSPPILLVMGVSGSGKTTVAKALADALDWPFEEGDELHPPANIAKMRAGIPLDDADRKPWLEAVGRWIDGQIAKGEPGLITCSALKRAYRDELLGGRAQARLVFLTGSPQVLEERVEHRSGHFMPASLLASQLETLEPPAPDEHAIVIDIDQSVEDQVRQIEQALFTGDG